MSRANFVGRHAYDYIRPKASNIISHLGNSSIYEPIRSSITNVAGSKNIRIIL